MNGEIVQLARKGIEELKSKYPNYSPTQIASKIGMHQSTFSRIENKQANPSLNSIMKIFASLMAESSLNDGEIRLSWGLKVQLQERQFKLFDGRVLPQELGSMQKISRGLIGKNYF